MADPETIAVTLTAALLRSIPNAGFRIPPGGGQIDRVEVARHAVILYETVLGMIEYQAKQ